MNFKSTTKTYNITQWGLTAIVVLLGLSLAALLVLNGCAGSKEGYTGGVAATVNGVEIPEDDVTDLIQNDRSILRLTEADAWAAWLESRGLTPETYRQSTIDRLVDQELIRQSAKNQNVDIDKSKIDEQVDKIRSNYETDEQWKKALEQAGYASEDEYRESIELGLMTQGLLDKFKDVNNNDESMLAAVKSAAENYNGAKRSSHILFASDDIATAQTVLNQLRGGSLDFAEAAAEYSTDTGSKDQGGDVGWDKATTFVDEYQNALDGLQKDQISNLVTSQFGIHIIKETDEFMMPESLTSLGDVPEEILDAIANDAFESWLKAQEDSENVVINPMPSGLIYDVLSDDEEQSGSNEN